MKLQLPNSIASQHDLMSLELEIREYAKWFSQNSIKQRLHAKRGTPPPVISPAAQELLKGWSAKTTLTSSSLDNLVSAIDRLKATSPNMTITLAAPPASDLKRTLVEWCRQNIEPNVLVDFRFNSTLLGGIVIRYGSQIFDWSFRRTLLAERQRFAEVLRHV